MPRIWELYLGKQAGYVIGATDLDPPHGCRKRRLRLVGQPAAPDLHGARHRPSRSADVPVCPSPIRSSAPPEENRAGNMPALRPHATNRPITRTPRKRTETRRVGKNWAGNSKTK